MTPPSGQRTYEIIDGTRVTCPARHDLITPYVLEEQQDWFEDEIRFLRSIIAADDVFIDIGANYGLYTLSAAKRSPGGHVWSYEPARTTAACLVHSIADNGFDNVTLVQKALSDRSGEGWLEDKGAAELHAVGAANGAGRGETITLTTLDDELHAHGWQRIDIVKIDVEGHESSVVAGGRELLASTSPLVMLEIKAGDRVDLAATRRLIDLGYQCWRLVPGLQALAPQDPAAAMDDYQLNLFCCKPDRADTLSQSNRLVLPAPGSDMPMTAGAGEDRYREALDLHALAMDTAQPVAERYRALCAGHARLRELLTTRPDAPGLLSFARMAGDLGMRREALEALQYFFTAADRFTDADFLREPLLSPSIEFDAITPHGTLRAWAMAAALDAFERMRSFSSFFSDPQTTLAVISELDKLGYLTTGMQRRAALARQRQGR